jgi:hypothetical protein
MQRDWTYSPEGGDRLASEAEQFERLVPFVSRPQVRVHLLERAAECRAKLALIRAGASPSIATGA